MRHALVTGASGFIGRRLCARLRAEGIEVTALHRHASVGPWQREKLCDLAAGPPPGDAFDGVDTVFHLAGHAHASDGRDAAAEHQAVSVDGTRRLLAACTPQVSGLVFASSVKAMGESTPARCLDEDAPARPTTAYGQARLAAETLVLGAPAPLLRTVLRLPLVYGPGVRGNLERMMRAARRARMPLLPDFGNRRTLAGVDHVVDAALAAALTPRAHGRVYLLGDGVDYTTREIQLLVYQAAGRRPPRIEVPRWSLSVLAAAGDRLSALPVGRVPFDSGMLAKLAANACFRITRAREELGFAPEGSLRDALPSMFAALDDAALRGESMNAWFVVFIAAVSALAASALAVRHLVGGRTLVILDHPNERSLHTEPTRRTGGIGIVIGIVAGEIVAWWIAGAGTAALAVAPAALLVLAVSLIDDLRGLGPLPRFVVQALAAMLLASAGVVASGLPVPGGVPEMPTAVAVGFSLLLVVWSTNLYNFMDGMDGLAGGMGVIGFATLALLAARGGDPRLAITCTVIAAACAGFLIFNFPPARIFMGDAGSSVLGFLVAGFGLAADHGGVFPLWLTLLVFSPFIVDATVTLLRRAAARERVWQAHRSHYYQRLVRLGWSHRRTTLGEYLLMSACAASALTLQGADTVYQVLGLCGWAVIYGMLMQCVNRLERRRKGYGSDAAG